MDATGSSYGHDRKRATRQLECKITFEYKEILLCDLSQVCFVIINRLLAYFVFYGLSFRIISLSMIYRKWYVNSMTADYDRVVCVKY